MNRNTPNALYKVLGLAAICVALAAIAGAQVQSQSSESSGTPTHEVKVQRAEVVLVSGNDLVVKMEDGTIKHIPNVPESARVTVDGKELGIHDLQPGMKLERTVTTTTTPKVITTVKSVTGKVWNVNPPNSVILTLDDNTNQQFTIPKGQKFNVDGQMVDAFGLKKGMRISATKVTEEPVTVVDQQAKVTGTNPPPPPPPDQPILIVMMKQPPPQQTAAAEPPAQLPKTGSMVPLFGMLGVLFCGISVGLRLLRNM